MTTQRAQDLLDASMGYALRPQKDDRKKLIAFVINEAAARLCTDWVEGQHPANVLYELANEVDALNEQMSPRSVNEQEWVDNADRGFTDWFHSFYGPHSSRSDYFQEIVKIEDPKERQDALMFWSKAAFFAGYECSLCDKLEDRQTDGG
jgi:hypothetical protein